MRLLIVTQADPLYMPIFFKFFTENLRNPEVEVRKVVILRPLNQRNKFGLLKKVLDLYGAWGTFRLLLRLLRVKVGTGTVEGYLKRAGIGYEHVEDINDGSVADYVRREGIDLVVSVAASQIFSEDLLSSPRYGCINVHHGRLPEYRGMMSTFWQMYNGEEFAVVTFHRMTEDLDRGEVLLEKKVKINYDRPLDYLIKKTKIFSALYMLDLLDEIAEDPGRLFQGRPQEGKEGYYPFPGREHGIAFRRKGLKLL